METLSIERSHTSRPGRTDVPVRVAGAQADPNHIQGWRANADTRCRILFNEDLDGVVLTNRDGVIVEANKAAGEMLGRTESELIGLGFAQLVDPSDPRSEALLGESSRGRRAVGELCLLRANGTRLDLEVACQAFREEDGIERMFIFLRDVSEVKRAKAQLMVLNSELERLVDLRTAELASAVKDLEAFAYSVSHDLRAPLRTMDGFAKVLHEEFGQQLPDKARHYLDRIRAGSSKLGTLIDDLLNFSRLGRQEMKVREFDPAAVVRDVLQQATSTHPHWNGRVDVRPLPLCRGDSALIRQLWANLIDNAFKYSAKQAAPLVEVGVEQHDGEDVYFVRDNGAGFDMEYVDKLFQVFQRLHSEHEFPGTGVGLAIVKRVAERHGGRVWAVGEPDRGATFFFTLAVPQTS